MLELKTLAQYVTDGRRKPDNERLKRYESAIEFLKSSPRVSDSELGVLLDMNPRKASFRMFKSRLRKRLLQQMLTTSLPDKYQEPYNDAILQCFIMKYSVRFLLITGHRSTAASLASDGLAKAKEFSLTESLIFFSRVLRTTASVKGDEIGFNKFKQECAEAIATLQAEEEANALGEAMTIANIKNTLPSKDLIENGTYFTKSVDALRKRFNSLNLNLSYFRLRGQLYYIQEDYHRGLKNWIECEDYLNKSVRFEIWARRSESLLNQLYCRLYVRDYDKAELLIEKLNSVIKPGSLHWLPMIEFEFLLYMHSRRFAEARQVYKSMMKSSVAATLREHEIERWELFSVYLLFIYTFLDSDGGTPKQINKRKVKDLIRNSPGVVKAKQGYNVSILVIQILWRIAENDYHEAADAIVAMGNYANKYLKGEEYTRSYLFVKMLTALEKEHFNLKKAQPAITPLLQKLNKLSEGSGGKLIDGMEVITYPDLWDIVVQMLKKNTAAVN